MLLHELLQEAVHGLASTEAEYFNKVVNFLISELNIPSNIKLDVAFKPSVQFDKDQSGLTIPNPSNTNHIFIFIAPHLSNGERVMTLAHEFVHVKQITDGRMDIRLQDGKYNVKWEGKQMDNLKYSRNTPWELEAHSQERSLTQKLVTEIGNISVDK